MKISRIVLKGVNNFEDFDYSFEDAWTQSVPDSLLLLGPNGSGKTTILRSIASLWDIFGRLIEGGDSHLVFQPPEGQIFRDCDLVAIKIENFLSDLETIWLYVGQHSAIKPFFDDHSEDYRCGITWQTDPKSFQTQFTIPGNVITSPDVIAGNIQQKLRERFIKNRLGGLHDLPNMVFFESEERYLQKTMPENSSVVPEKEIFSWLANYEATSRREGSIENYLFTLKAIKPDVYDRIVTEVNKFFAGKGISGFDERTSYLLITTHSGQTHPIHLLSSGEKQVLLMIAYIVRELRPGGIVLIDEPDLHLHVSLSTAFVSYLKRMVAEQEGQLIIASHAPELWDRFTDAEKVRLGAALEVGG